jgi:hypothetical protein
MSVFDVLVDSEDIVVLGPPTTLDVSLGIGEKGERGSKFFIGSGDPNTLGVIPSSEEIILGDVFINTSTSSQFSWLYLYAFTPSGNIWAPALRLQPSIYSRNNDVTFDSNGLSSLIIPLGDIVPDTNVTDVDRFVVQITAINSNPVAITVNSKLISSSNFVIAIEAIEFSSLAWSALTGTVKLAVTISVV